MRRSTSREPSRTDRAAAGGESLELPPLDAFGTLVVLVIAQQLSVAATRTIVSHLLERFEGHVPSPRELLAADPGELHSSGMSTRKSATVRALAERFVDGRLSDESLARMSHEDVTARLTEIPGIGPWTAHGYLFESELEKGT